VAAADRSPTDGRRGACLLCALKLSSDVGAAHQTAQAVQREEKPVFLADFDKQAARRFSQRSHGYLLNARLIGRRLKTE
jgi:hypothetical protein